MGGILGRSGLPRAPELVTKSRGAARTIQAFPFHSVAPSGSGADAAASNLLRDLLLEKG